LREHRADCRLPLALLPAILLPGIRQLTLFAKNPSKSTLAHDAVAAAVLHKHHPIALVQASSSLSIGRTRAGPRGSLHQKLYFHHFFARVFSYQLEIMHIQSPPPAAIF